MMDEKPIDQLKPKIAIVIPVHNRAADTLECLESLYQSDYPCFEVILVDDGSTDGTSQLISEHFPDAVVLQGDGNLWWSGGVNLGIQEALSRGYDYIFLINNDCIISSSCLTILLTNARTRGIEILGCVVYNYHEPEAVTFCGGKIDWKRGGGVWYGIKELAEANGESYQTDFFGGRGVLVSRKVFDRVLLFNNVDFPHYYGDIDFWLRAKRAGITMWIDPAGRVWNKEVEEIEKLHTFRERIKFFRFSLFNKHSPRNLRDTFVFYSQHCPLVFLPLALSHYYGPIIRKTLGIPDRQTPVNI